jgi:hypothetical protein
MSERPCGIKPTPSNNAYTKNELIRLAEQAGINRDISKIMSMKDLCSLLGLENSVAVKNTPENECKYSSTNQLIEKYINKLTSQNISREQAEKMSKDYLCDVIFDLQANLVVPEDFDEKTCDLYDIDMLKRIARKIGIEYQSNVSKQELCKSLQVDYFIKKNKIIFDNKKSTNWKDITKGDYKCLIPLNDEINLEKHQMDVARHMLTHRGLIAVHSVGSGKTLSAVSSINCVLAKYPNLKVTIITPLSLKNNFKDEMIKFGLDLNDLTIASKIRIFSYEGFVNYFIKHPKECKNTFLIVDEAHNLRSEIKLSKLNKIEKGSRAYYIMKCAASAFKVLLLTATPIVNRPFDLRNLLMIVEGKEPETAESYKHFKNTVLESPQLFINEFRCKVSMFSIDLTNNPDYPKRIDMPIEYITMDSDYYNKYRQIELKKMEDLKYTSLVGSSEMFYTSLRRAVNALDSEFSPKVNAIFDFIMSEAKAGRKSVVYSNWKAAGMNLLRKRLDQKGVKNLYGYISGDLTEDQRKMFRDKINKGIAKILLISRAGGEGLNLKEIRNVIIMESNWNVATDEQIIGRAIRKFSHKNLPQQDQNVRVYRFMMIKPKSLKSEDELESIDEVLYDIAYKKKQPEINQYLDYLKQASIEQNNCKCDDGSAVGCEISELAERKKVVKSEELKKLEEEQAKKNKEELQQIISDSKFIYVAPNNVTSLAVDIKESGIATYKKLAGIEGDIIRVGKAVLEDDDEVQPEEIKIQQKKRRKIILLDEDEAVIEGNSPALDPDEEVEEDEEVEAELITSSQEIDEPFIPRKKKLNKSQLEDEPFIPRKKKLNKSQLEDEPFIPKKKKLNKSQLEDEPFIPKKKKLNKDTKKRKYDFEEEQKERDENIKAMEESLEELGGRLTDEEFKEMTDYYASLAEEGSDAEIYEDEYQEDEYQEDEYYDDEYQEDDVIKELQEEILKDSQPQEEEENDVIKELQEEILKDSESEEEKPKKKKDKKKKDKKKKDKKKPLVLESDSDSEYAQLED